MTSWCVSCGPFGCRTQSLSESSWCSAGSGCVFLCASLLSVKEYKMKALFSRIVSVHLIGYHNC